jgi:hypothetical protein
MFCPKCAAENHDQTRFCRGCGTDLEVVALALNTELTPTELGPNKESNLTVLLEQRLKLQIDGIRQVFQGGLIFATGILLGIPLALFGKDSDWHSNWILVWLVTCGWLPVWGAYIMGTGLSNLINLRMIQRRTDSLGATASNRVSVHWSGQTQRIAEAESTNEVAASLKAGEQSTHH